MNSALVFYLVFLFHLCWFFCAFNFQITTQADGTYDEQALNKIREDRGYSFEDHVEISRETLPNYDEKVNLENKIEQQ